MMTYIHIRSSVSFRLLWMAILLVSNWNSVESNWLYLAISSPAEPLPSSSEFSENSRIDRSLYGYGCDNLVGLNNNQKDVCYQHPYAMPSVGYGARSAIVECQYQFKYERWNCTTRQTDNDTHVDIFGATLREANKEAAFLSAITSAGVVHSVTKACAAGKLSYCGCDATVSRTRTYKRQKNTLMALAGQQKSGNNPKKQAKGTWTWGGCSDDVRFGVGFSEDFLDRAEKEGFRKHRDTRHLMNLHNHNVGRQVRRTQPTTNQAISNFMTTNCRCHGVSGSCELKTCWQSMPRFSQVGTIVKSWYDRHNVQVARRSKKRLRRKERSERKVPVRSNELVYLNRSPNYCVRNEEMGIMGTEGRECNRTSIGSDSCDLLCCGRGYNTKTVTATEMCKCKFVWCCHVKCKNCTTSVDVHTCK